MKAGLDFNSGAPVPIQSGIGTFGTDPSEGCASLSDVGGNLLFYTDGQRAYNNTHGFMSPGTPVAPFSCYSTSQGSVIIPVIGTTHQYYIFSLEWMNFMSQTCRLVYSKIDMSLDTGRGAIITPTMITPFEDSLSEKMIAIAGNNNNIWLLVHRKDTAVFLAYEITSSGINSTPVTSVTGNLSGQYCYTWGVIKSSPDRKKLISMSDRGPGAGTRGAELYDFSPATGIVSNCVTLDTASGYGAEFSPDNTKVYTQQSYWPDSMAIYQFDLSLSGISAIRASKTRLMRNQSRFGSDIKLGPDYKLYLAGGDDSTKSHLLNYTRYIDCITAPNNAGTACGYVSHAVKLLDGTGMYFGMTNLYVIPSTGPGDAGIDESGNSAQLSIFPNPASTELFITSSGEIEDVSIYNTLGREVCHRVSNGIKMSINISSLPAGIYIVRINGSLIRRFVKQ